jgi:uncharacterized repeat protein (TIGR03943 family)
VTPRLQGTLVLATGGVATYLAVSGRFLDYLKPGMHLPLLGAGSTMLVLGALTLVRARNHTPGQLPADPAPAIPGDHDHAHTDHGDHHGPSVAWLLLLPLLALVLVRPPALGADAARRDSSERLPAPTDRGFDPLPPARDGAVDLTLTEFMTRSYYDERESLAGAAVRLTGFVVGDADLTDGYRLTRFRMSCCAADAFPIRITVRGLDGPPPSDDTWVEVVGQWVPPSDPDASGADRGAALTITAQTPIPAPADSYE